MKSQTVSKKWIKSEIAALEKSAQDNVQAWVLSGQANKYAAMIEKATALRYVLLINSPALRRQRLRQMNYIA